MHLSNLIKNDFITILIVGNSSEHPCSYEIEQDLQGSTCTMFRSNHKPVMLGTLRKSGPCLVSRKFYPVSPKTFTGSVA